MTNVLIYNAKTEYFEYAINIDDITEAVGVAIEQYITNELKFNSIIFPITEDFWLEKIKTAVENETLTLRDKINLLNSICKISTLKITKIFAGYSIGYEMN